MSAGAVELLVFGLEIPDLFGQTIVLLHHVLDLLLIFEMLFLEQAIILVGFVPVLDLRLQCIQFFLLLLGYLLEGILVFLFILFDLVL